MQALQLAEASYRVMPTCRKYDSFGGPSPEEATSLLTATPGSQLRKHAHGLTEKINRYCCLQTCLFR